MDEKSKQINASAEESALSMDEKSEHRYAAVNAAGTVEEEAHPQVEPSQDWEEDTIAAPSSVTSVAFENVSRLSQVKPPLADCFQNVSPKADSTWGNGVSANLLPTELPQVSCSKNDLPKAVTVRGDMSSSQAEDTQPAPSRGSPTKLERKEPTREEIDRTFTEAARNRDEYLDYRHDRFEEGGGRAVDLFTAKRIGLSHIRKGMPCQDACGYEKIPHGFVLLDADGISACKFGEIGSRLACETAGERIGCLSRETPDESDFIRVLMSVDFYRGLREAWIQRLRAHHEAEVGPWDNRSLYNYGTTLLIAVLTEHWIATLNLGDGQILMFNEGECQYVRLAEKEGNAPKSLIYGTYLEDVQRGLWSRARYRGVLLTTDGINDLLDKIPSFEGRTSGYNYALQIESRFMEKGEPFQPFVYRGKVLGMNRTIDLSRQRNASDDCSVVLAVDSGYVPCDEGVVEQLKRRFGQEALVQLLRRTGDRACYLVGVDKTLRMVYQLPASDLLVLHDPRLNEFGAGNVRMWNYESRWLSGDLHFSAYLFPRDVRGQTLEAGFQCADFSTVHQFHKTENPSTGETQYVVEPLLGERMLMMYDTLTSLKDHLATQNLYLQTGAPFWIVMLADEDDTFLVPWEALSEHPACEAAPWCLDIEQLFPGLIGRLVCKEHSVPLFAPGNDALDVDYYLFNTMIEKLNNGRNNIKECRFFKIRYNPSQNSYGMMNTGVNAWSIIRADGTMRIVEPGKTVLMMNGDQIDVKVGTQIYSYQVYLR